MSWRKGLLRFWLVASLIWAAAFGWFEYEKMQAAAVQHAIQERCVEGQTAAGSNPFECFRGDYAKVFEDLIPFSYATWIRQHVVPVVLPPLGLLAFGLLFAWVFSGFKGKSSQP